MLKNMIKRLKDQRGLTLIELLAVIVILGIIGAIGVPSIVNIIQNSKEDAVKAEAIQVINAGKLYIASEGATDPTPSTITKVELAPFVDGIDLENYELSVTTGNVIKITANGKAGDKAVSFNAATIEDINAETVNRVTMPN